MKNIIYKSFSIVSASVLFFSCKPEIVVPAADKGSLDLSAYVSIGNSVTSGYTDNALYYSGQQVSYPNLIAQQFKLAGGGNFKQPLVSATSVGIGSMQNARLALMPAADCQGTVSLAPVPVDAQGDASIFTTSVAAQGPFNNMAVPGAKAITVVYPGYGNPSNGPGLFNPFFTRMTTDPANASILSDAVAQKPTFISLSIGNDDVMAFAFAGGAAETITPLDGPPGVGFNASMDYIVSSLTANGAKGVIANIPDIASLPYFTTVPYNGLVLDKSNADALTAAYAPLGITFQEGPNGFIIEDATAPGGLRQIHPSEMVLLSVPQDSLKCGGWGSLKPIPNQYVLTDNEISEVSDAITAYNVKLKSAATASGLAFVDLNSFFKNVKTGIVFNGVKLNMQFVAGGAFSLDGIHMTPMGNALLANEYIKAINATYKCNIPRIDATRYKGISFP